MANAENVNLPQLITKNRDWLINNWLDQQRGAGADLSDRGGDGGISAAACIEHIPRALP